MRNIVLFLFFVISVRVSGVKVVGNDTAVISGESATLFCQLLETNDDVTRITWRRKTSENPVENPFFVIHQNENTENLDGLGDRVQFIGSIAEKNGSIELLRMRLSDEGIYTCIFNLLQSRPLATDIKVTILARPAVDVRGESPVVGLLEATLALCSASNARPAAEVTWRLGDLENSLKTKTNHTVNPDGTATVVSYLLGVPFKHLSKKNVQCVIKHKTLNEDLVLNYTIDIHYPPESVIIIPDNPTNVNEFQCIVDSNPQPTANGYIWTRVNKSTPVYEGNKLPLPVPLTSDFNGLYICKASNKHGSALGSIYVHFRTETSTVYRTLFILLIIAVLAFAAAVGAAYKFKPEWFRKHSDDREPGNRMQEQQSEPLAVRSGPRQSSSESEHE